MKIKKYRSKQFAIFDLFKVMNSKSQKGNVRNVKVVNPLGAFYPTLSKFKAGCILSRLSADFCSISIFSVFFLNSELAVVGLVYSRLYTNQ